MSILAFDTTAKIRRSLYLRVYVLTEHKSTPEVLDVRLRGGVPFITRFTTGPASPTDRLNVMIEVYALAEGEFDFAAVSIEIEIETDGVRERLSADHEQIGLSFVGPKYTVIDTWTREMDDHRIRTVLDIGGRARSGVSRKDMFPGKSVAVADILDAPDVDYVADVHELSSHVDRKFDAFMSIATFEHLLMPWKAAIEINKVLNDGGIGLVVTHQTTGIHDVPWDYYRYSDNAWKGVFNPYTGFEILDAGMVQPAMIIPRRWLPVHEGTEHAVGYLTSSVVVRKVSEPRIDWPVPVPSITADLYPE